MSRFLYLFLCLFFTSVSYAQDALNIQACYGDLKQKMVNGQGVVECIGDSLTYRQYGLHENLRNLLQSRYGDGGKGYQGFSRWQGAGINPTWIEGPINQDLFPYRGLDGMWISHEVTGNTSAYIIANNNSSDLLYLKGPQQSSFFFVPSFGSAVTVNTNDTGESIGTTHFTSATGGLNWVYPNPVGKVTLIGLNNLSGNSGPVVHRAANGGWGIDNFLQRDWTFDALNQYLGVDLYIVMLGQNDGGMFQSVYETKLTQLYNRLIENTPNAKILFVSSYDSGTNAGLAHSEAMRTVATTTGSGFIDLYTIGGNYQYYVDHNYLDDGLHFNQAGGLYISTIVFNALENGTGLICDNIDFNHDNLFPDSSDIDDYLAVFSGGICPLSSCDLDFNNDGLSPDTADIDSLLSVFSGGPCL